MTASAGGRAKAAWNEPPSTSTRDRILIEAGDLFARQGYHATTTRQIADAVGIRQPSLFHHFASKAAIAEALLTWDLERAYSHVVTIAALPEGAAVRLYRYLYDDIVHLSKSPFNLSGIYAEEVIGRAEFAKHNAMLGGLHDTIEGVVREGIASGEFVVVDAVLVRQAIAGILYRALTLYSGGRGEGESLAHEISRLVVRGLLRDPDQLDAAQRRALDLAV